MTHHGGKVLIDFKALLDWLQFNGGKIHYIGRPEEFLNQMVVLIEHPDMPEVPEGGEVPIVFVTYREKSFERIEPKMGIRTILRRLLSKWHK